MSCLLRAAAIICFGVTACQSSAPTNQEHQLQHEYKECVLAVTNVNVIPMTDNLVISGQTVLFGQSEIIEISKKGTGAVACDRIVDGKNRYLMPGLNDLHTHVENTAFQQGFGLPTETLPYDILLTPYLVNSITGIRILSGSPDLLAYRESVGHSDRAPHLVVASPMLSATPPVLPEPVTRIVDDPSAARAAIRDYAEAGYDFIKIRRNLSLPVYEAVIEEAHLVGMHVDGHVTQAAAGLDALLSSGQDGFAHLDEFALRISDELAIENLAEMLVECGCYVSTAIGVMPNIAEQIKNYDGLVAREEMQVMHPLLTNAFWLKPSNPYLREGAPVEFFDDLAQKTSDLVRPLYDAGVPLLAGSDAINPMIVPGYGLLDELDLLVEAGLSPFEALRTATAIPAKSVPGFEQSGILEKGRKSNAVLLASNPLADLAVLGAPDAVILNGSYLDQQTLKGRLNEAIKTVKQP